MKKIRVLKLGTVCVDKATKLKGTLTHWAINMSGYISYIFQPKGLNDEGQPVSSIYFEPGRLEVKEEDFEEIEVPIEILGTQVTHDPTGFNGMVVAFLRHLNGCFHVYIQPEGVLKKNKQVIEKMDFDFRSCSGKMIKQLSETELEKSKKDEPSPIKISCSEIKIPIKTKID